MDFLRLHLPGLHQALRGALDSFSTFVSYLLGDEVPTTAGAEAQAAEELGEVGAGKLKRVEEEEARGDLEGLGGGQSKGDEGPSGPAKARKHQKRSLEAEQTSGWGEGSSHGSQADRQDTEAWEAAKAARCQEPSAPSEAGKKSEAESVAGQDRSSQAQERQEPGEPEMSRGETLRTWEQEEEEEEVRTREPRVAGGAESDWTWQREPEGKADVGKQNAARDGKETQGPEARGPGKKEEVIRAVRGGQITEAQEPWGPGAEPELWASSDREEARTPSSGEEAWTTPEREDADHLVVRETECGAVPGQGTPEGTESLCPCCSGDLISHEVGDKEAPKENWEEGVDEKRKAEESLLHRHSQMLRTEGREEAAGEAVGGLGLEKEVGESFKGQEDQSREESKGRQDSGIGAEQARLEEVIHAEEGKEERGSNWVTEALFSQNKEAKGAEGDVDLEAMPEARPEKAFVMQRSEEEAQTDWEALRVEWEGPECEITEGQEPALKPEGKQGAKEEHQRAPAPGKEEAERNLEEDSQFLEYVQSDGHVTEADAWGNWWQRDVETGNIQEKADAEEAREEAAGGQPLEAEAKRGHESEILTISETDEEWKKAKDTVCGTEEEEALEAENEEPGGGHRAGAGTGQSLEGSESEAKDWEVELAVPGGADTAPGRGWRLEEVALSLQASEGMQTGRSVVTKIVEDKAALDIKDAKVEAGDTWERAFRRDWGSQVREEPGGGGEAAGGGDKGRQEFSLEGSAEERVPGKGHQSDAFEAKEGEYEGESAVAGGNWRMDQLTSGSHLVTAEGTMATGEGKGLPERQTVEGTEVGQWQVMELRADNEGQCDDRHLEGLPQRPLDLEDVEVAGGQRSETEGVRETRKTKEAGEAEEASEAKEGGVAKETAEAQEAEEAKEAKETEEDREVEEAREAEEASKAEEAGEAEEASKVEEAGEAEEASKVEEAGEAEEASKVEEAGEAEEASKVEEAGEAEEASKVEEAGEAEEASKVEEAGEAEEASKVEEAGEAEEASKVEEAGEAEEASKVEEAGEAEEASKVEEAGEAEEASKVEEAGEAEEEREAKEAMEVEEAREARKAKESWEGGEAREANKTGVAKETEEARETEEVKEAKETEEAGEAEETGEVEAEEFVEAKEAGKAGEAEETSKAKEAMEVEEAWEARKAKESGEAQEAGGAKETEEAREAVKAEEDKEAQGTEETGEAEEVRGVEEDREAEEVVEAKRAGKAGDTEETQDTKETTEIEEAGEAEEADKSEEADSEGMKDEKGQKEQLTAQDPPKAEPELRGEAEAAETTESARGHAHSSWSQTLLPGPLLDVSVSRSRALLSRSSSQRRSRPSFRRTPAPGLQEKPPSPPCEAELSAPRQRLLQSTEPPEPSSQRPEGTPVPARKRPLGRGFGLAHSGMMQELQARLGQPKPQ